MDLKLGAATFSYLWNTPLPDALAALAGMGYRYIEATSAPPHFWPRGLDARERDRVREAVGRLGLEIVALNPTGQDINLASTNPGIHAETVVQLKEQLRLARDLGAKVIVVPAGRLHTLVPAPLATAWQLTKEAIAACLDEAGRCGVHFGLENVPFSFLRLGGDLVRLIGELGSHPNLKIVYDVANAHMVEDTVRGLETVAPYLALVHVSDTLKARWGHTAVGTGEVDFAPVAGKLSELGYGGVTIVEVIDPGDPGGGLAASAPPLEALGWRR